MPRQLVHVCGWGLVDGTWRCIQDYKAAGGMPQTSCGATWDPATGVTTRPEGWVPPVVIRLTAAQLAEAFAAADRVERRRKLVAPLFDDPDRIGLRRCSAASELAVSLYTGLPWHGHSVAADTDKSLADVGDDIEVRYTRYWALDALLRLDKRDQGKAARRWVLVIGEPPELRIMGWLYGHEVMVPRYWQEVGVKVPCWSVPAAELRAPGGLVG